MTDKKRITNRCWNKPDCGRDYSLLKEFDGQPTFLIACPFCGAEAVVRLDPYVSPVREIYAGGDAPLTLDVLNLPDVLPSEPRPEQQEEGD
jgi:hypothetical protein